MGSRQLKAKNEHSSQFNVPPLPPIKLYTVQLNFKHSTHIVYWTFSLLNVICRHMWIWMCCRYRCHAFTILIIWCLRRMKTVNWMKWIDFVEYTFFSMFFLSWVLSVNFDSIKFQYLLIFIRLRLFCVSFTFIIIAFKTNIFCPDWKEERFVLLFRH